MNFNEFEKWAEQEVKRYNESSLKNNDIEFRKIPAILETESFCFEIKLCNNSIFGYRGEYIFYNNHSSVDIRYKYETSEVRGLSGITMFFEIKRETTIEKAQQFIKGLL